MSAFEASAPSILLNSLRVLACRFRVRAGKHSRRDQSVLLARCAPDRHEIATPINTIAGVSVAVLTGTISERSAREEGQEIVEVELDRVRALLSDIRNLGAIDAGQVPRRASVDLGVICQRAHQRFATMAQERGITLRLQSGSAVIETDQRMVETVLDNLVSNAIRYTPTNGLVEIAVDGSGEEVSIVVKDTGIGISAEQRQHVFERFYRTDSARDRESGGTGLGLSIAQTVAFSLGGRIELDSVLGKGSGFRLVLTVKPKHIKA